MPPREQAAFLTGSSERVQVLRSLRKDSHCPRDIAEKSSVSRRGVQRNLTEFAERGWAEKVDGVYRLTTYGALIERQYSNFLNALAVFEKCKEFIRHLPDSGHTPNPKWLRAAEITVADSSRPHAPAKEYIRRLHEISTDTLRGLLPIVDQFCNEVHVQLLTERNVYQSQHLHNTVGIRRYSRKRSVEITTMTKTTAENFAWVILAVAVSGFLIYPGFQELSRGSPMEEWAPQITLGVLFLLVSLGLTLVSWLEGDRSGTDRFGLTGWTVLVGFGSWLVVGLVFLSVGYSSNIVKMYTVLGAIGVAGAFYKAYEVRQASAG